MKTNATFRPVATLAGVASLLLFAAASARAASGPALPDAAEAVSAQGPHLLVLTLALLAALVLMERLCAWRLAIRHRLVVDAPALRDALPTEPTVFAGPLAADFQ